jgi:4-amino-4-deoxy-L-arabinose transferase-like glycosyltransferase
MNKYQVLALLSIIYISFFYKSGPMPVRDAMEARNLVTVREMWESGNWLIPTMNGEIRFAKPPLPTWLTLAGARVGGGLQNLSAMRFPAALSAALMVLFTFYLARALEFDASTAYRSALVLSTSFLTIQEGRIATWDIFAYSFMTGGLWTLVSGIKYPRGSWIYLTLAGIFLGLSFLSKGPVAFYFTLLPFVLSYFLIHKPAPEKLFWKQVIWMILLFLLIAASWYLYIFFHRPDLSKAMLVKETRSWVTSGDRPSWFYLYFPIVTGVWVIGCIAALVKPFGEGRIKPFKAYSLLLWWVLLTLLALSIIPKKKPRYLLPYLIPMCLMLGHLWTYWIDAFRTKRETVWDRRVISVHTVSLIILSLVMPSLIAFGVYKGLISTAQGILFAVMFALIGGVGIWFLRRKAVHSIFSLTLILVCVSSLFVMQALPHISKYQAMRGVGNESPIAELPIYSSVPMDILAIWEIGRTVTHLKLDEVVKDKPCGPFALFTMEPPDQIVDFKDTFDWEIIAIYPRRGEGKYQKWYLSVLSLSRMSRFRQCEREHVARSDLALGRVY